MIQLTPVISSNIDAVGYDPGASTLYIRFKPSTKVDPATGEPKPSVCLAYYGIPKSLYDEMTAPGQSVGSFYHANIRGQKIGEEVEIG